MDARSVDVGNCLSRVERGFAALIVVANFSLVGWLAAGAEFGGIMDSPAPDAAVVHEQVPPGPAAAGAGAAIFDESLARASADPGR